jgi:hypothetical protein
MAENIQRSRGRASGYKFDRGGQPTEMGPYIGIVVNNVDNTRSGRLQVYIAEFGATDKERCAKFSRRNIVAHSQLLSTFLWIYCAVGNQHRCWHLSGQQQQLWHVVYST